MLVYVRYNKDKFQYDVTKEYFRAAVTPGRTSVEYHYSNREVGELGEQK